MKKVLKIILYILFFSFSFILFLPKENLYFLFEKALKKEEIIISQELIDDKLLYLKISNGNIIYKRKPYAKFESVSISTKFFFSHAKITNIFFLNKNSSKYENLIDILSINYSIINPLNITIKGIGKMGKMTGIINLKEKIITLELEPSRLVKIDFNYLFNNWKLVKGKYYYEYQF
ncbi:hypothetical protein CRV02_12780 [Arcobacter sp. CECT 8989]|uniref:hypothetical protein n=1 Tax=Arcobacter sp. CECT 8989 TaxID=2044509 RepID=UPI00100B56FA|nr:hypothetical protein [Arcobacter sp. CECT 8989]RXJ98920.1 hypothetical protein CRV02_12780 [Arcobacter sp. CECT 8989]